MSLADFIKPLHGRGAALCTSCRCLLRVRQDDGDDCAALRQHFKRKHNVLISRSSASRIALQCTRNLLPATQLVPNGPFPVPQVPDCSVVSVYQCSLCMTLLGTVRSFKKHVQGVHTSSLPPPSPVLAHPIGYQYVWISVGRPSVSVTPPRQRRTVHTSPTATTPPATPCCTTATQVATTPTETARPAAVSLDHAENACYLQHSSGRLVQESVAQEVIRAEETLSLPFVMGWWINHDPDLLVQDAVRSAIARSTGHPGQEGDDMVAAQDPVKDWFDRACRALESSSAMLKSILQYGGDPDKFLATSFAPTRSSKLEVARRFIRFVHRMYWQARDARFRTLLPCLSSGSPSSLSPTQVQAIVKTALFQEPESFAGYQSCYLVELFLKGLSRFGGRDGSSMSSAGVRKHATAMKFILRLALTYEGSQRSAVHTGTPSASTSTSPSSSSSSPRDPAPSSASPPHRSNQQATESYLQDYQAKFARAANAFSALRYICSTCDAMEKSTRRHTRLLQVSTNGVYVSGKFIRDGQSQTAMARLLKILADRVAKLFLGCPIPGKDEIVIEENESEDRPFWACRFRSLKRKRVGQQGRAPERGNDFAPYLMQAVRGASCDIAIDDELLYSATEQMLLLKGVNIWCAYFEEFLERLGVAVFLASGSPPRVSEFTTTSFVNTTTAKRTLVYDPERGLWCNIISYSKNGPCRPVFRWVHPQVNHYLTLTVACLHPFYRAVGVIQGRISDTYLDPMLLQRNWEHVRPDSFRETLRSVLARELDFPLSVSEHRQYVAYIQQSVRMKAMMTEFANSPANTENERRLMHEMVMDAFQLAMSDAMQTQFGHTAQTGADYYGRTLVAGRTPTRRRLQFWLSSRMMHVHYLQDQPRPLRRPVRPAASSRQTDNPFFDPTTASTDEVVRYITHVLQERFGHEDFTCEEQRRACVEAVRRRNVVLSMPTGRGKTLTWFLPALCARGITVVVVPLRALASTLHDRLVTISPYSTVWWKHENRDRIQSIIAHVINRPACAAMSYQVVIATPEQFRDQASGDPAEIIRFLHSLRRAGLLDRLVVDEAHCLVYDASWRPAYHTLAQSLHRVDVPVTAVTATILDSDWHAMFEALRITPQTAVSIRADPNRPELQYRVVPQSRRMIQPALLDMLCQMLLHPVGTAIVFFPDKSTLEAVYAEALRTDALRTACLSKYHADLPAQELVRTTRNVTADTTSRRQILFATTAWGLGMDAAHVRWVVIYGAVHSIIDLQQMMGRGARQREETCDCVFLYCSEMQRQLRAVAQQQQEPGSRELKVLREVEHFAESNTCHRAYLNNLFRPSAAQRSNPWAPPSAAGGTSTCLELGADNLPCGRCACLVPHNPGEQLASRAGAARAEQRSHQKDLDDFLNAIHKLNQKNLCMPCFMGYTSTHRDGVKMPTDSSRGPCFHNRCLKCGQEGHGLRECPWNKPFFDAVRQFRLHHKCFLPGRIRNVSTHKNNNFSEGGVYCTNDVIRWYIPYLFNKKYKDTGNRPPLHEFLQTLLDSDEHSGRIIRNIDNQILTDLRDRRARLLQM